MLEFLKECDQFNIYDRAHDCEIALSATNSAVSFAVFFEITFKSIYAYFVHEERYSNDPTLFELLSNERLTGIIEKQYGFKDFETVQHIRKKSNLAKHEVSATPISAAEKKEYFCCVFRFCSLFYAYQTGKKAPAWSDSQYDKLLKRFTDRQAHEQLKREFSEKVTSLQAELENAQKSRITAEERAKVLQKQLEQEKPGELISFSTEHIDDTYPLISGVNAVSTIRLSDSQKKAVECEDKYIAVVAGPGSGKTRVLTERIRYLVTEKGVPEKRILALTFSSKAANEVRKRLKDQMGIRACRVEVKTFHSFGLRMIRQHADLVGLTSDVEILDDTERYRVIRKIMSSMRQRYNDAPSLSEIRQTAQAISSCKSGLNSGNNQIKSLTDAYDKELRRGNYIDFDDMVVLTRFLLMKFPDLRAAYKERYQHVLVDEVQDVNAYQIDVIRGLIGKSTTFFIVGDDDQCIYEWRGAVPTFLRNVAGNPEFTVIRLEENYRSETSIVKASASFISRNINRITKHITARKKNQEQVTSSTHAYWLGNEKEEADFIAKQIQTLVHGESYSYGDITILVRGHKQIPAIKAALLSNNIPCFCQEDMSHYDSFIPVLRAVANIEKKGTINRAVNFPNRVMDNFLYMDLKEKYRLSDDLSVLEVFDYLNDCGGEFRDCELFRARYQLIRELSSKASYLSVSEIIKRLVDYYSTEDSRAKDEQLNDAYGILNLAAEFDKAYGASSSDDIRPLDEFLDYIMLVQEDESDESNQDESVNLMTCHRSKGLEFPVVFIAGVQCGSFPDDQYITSADDVEAERRLLYVSMTRAIDRLYITCSNDPYAGKQIFDRNGNLVVSFKGFLADIPDLVLQKRQQLQ